jgi:hypothetical protein
MTAAIASLLGQVPLWAAGLIILAVLLVIAAVGYGLRRLHDRRHPSPDKDEKESGQEGYLVSGVLGLFALLLGFTFALAVDRFDMRRGFVLDEANAIGTAYLRSQLLEAPHRERISSLLVAYTDNRLLLARLQGPPSPEQVAEHDRLVTAIWQATVSAFPTIRDYDFSSSYIDSINTVIDLDSARIAARRAHVPGEVFVVLAVYGAGVALVLGYVLVGWRGRLAGTFLIALFTLAVMLIFDIDSAATGGIRESQEPIERLRASLTSWPPGVFDSPPQ